MPNIKFSLKNAYLKFFLAKIVLSILLLFGDGHSVEHTVATGMLVSYFIELREDWMDGKRYLDMTRKWRRNLLIRQKENLQKNSCLIPKTLGVSFERGALCRTCHNK